ncbi:MAG: PQQ-binding-like beta-propeller repeat protein [Vicinamibacterales bacterium]
MTARRSVAAGAVLFLLLSAGCGPAPSDRELWRFSMYNRRLWHGWCAAAAPAVDGDRLYVGGGYGWWTRKTALWALNRHTGAVVWTAAVPQGVSFDTSSGAFSALTIEGGVVLAAVGDGLGAFSATDGERMWLRPNTWPMRAVAGDAVFAVTQSRLIALDLHTGRERWQRSLPEPPAAAPVVVGGRVFVGAARRAALLAFDAESGNDAEAITGLPGFNGSFVLVAKRILAGAVRDARPVTYVIDAETGAVESRTALLVGHDAPVAYFATADGGLEVVDVTSGRTERRWPRLPQAADGGIVVDRDVFYQQNVRAGGGAVHAYELASGMPAWSFVAGDWINGMALAPGALYVSSEDCGVYALRTAR